MTFDPLSVLADARIGILATIKSDGRPQLSPITPTYDADAGVIRVSITEGRAKTRNLRRDPRATLEVTSWDEYRAAMVSDRRVLMEMSIDRVYGERIR
jgi:nitroimidazol reductase NimA-like FMN-containing flavoprotein (pyridoxamine 5'-phosphate oxidase superfamily)